MLIALGSALFTIMSMDLVEGSPADRSRVASNIVTGVGFLGGGAILRTGHSIQGLTTAATIWVIAAIGMAAGAGRYALAVAATGATLLVLLALPVLERYVEGRVRDVRPTEGGRQSSE
jgi:putative Mg2+ transporter-C (MgtC) family protein